MPKKLSKKTEDMIRGHVNDFMKITTPTDEKKGSSPEPPLPKKTTKKKTAKRNSAI